MPRDRNSRKNVVLRADGGIESALTALLIGITSDGRISDAEIAELRSWLQSDVLENVPAVPFLSEIVDASNSDVTDATRRALLIAIERVLPARHREAAKIRRSGAELFDRTQRHEAAEAIREEHRRIRANNRTAASANSIVAGVSHGRAGIVQFIQEDAPLFLAREPQNAFDKNAIQVLTKNGYMVGYVPRDHAVRFAPMLG